MTRLLLFATTEDVPETFHTKKDALKLTSKPQTATPIPEEYAFVILMIVTILFKKASYNVKVQHFKIQQFM